MIEENYDFRKPGRPPTELDRRLGGWLRRFCTLAPERWARQLPFGVELELKELTVSSAEAALAQLPDPAVGFRLRLHAPETVTLFVLPRQAMLALVAGLLGDAAAELPADRPLTTVEESLAQFVAKHLLASVLEEAYPGLDGVKVQPRDLDPAPRFARLCPPDHKAVLGVFHLRGPFGEVPGYWFLPYKGWVEQAEKPKGGTAAGPPMDTRAQIEPVVRELPVEIVVRLGGAELPLQEVARLRVGDLLLLDQMTNEPLTARVAGEPKFRVWPGKVGSRQAVEIASLQQE